MKAKKIFFKVLLKVIICIFFINTTDYIEAACCGDVQRGCKTFCPNFNCSWERGDKRCNDDSQCCPGKRCSSFGFCEPCDY